MDNYICDCYQLTESEVINCINKFQCSDINDLSRYCLAGLGCGSCREIIEEIIEEINEGIQNDEKI